MFPRFPSTIFFLLAEVELRPLIFELLDAKQDEMSSLLNSLKYVTLETKTLDSPKFIQLDATVDCVTECDGV